MLITINTLQKEQSDPCMAFEAITGQQALYQNLILPWVYNQQGFEYILERLLSSTEQAIYRHRDTVIKVLFALSEGAGLAVNTLSQKKDFQAVRIQVLITHALT